MSKTVLRVGGGEITHVKVAHKTFLSKSDHEIYLGHKISSLDIQQYYGDDSKLTLRNEIFRILNDEVDINQLKFDIMRSCDYFKDTIIVTH